MRTLRLLLFCTLCAGGTLQAGTIVQFRSAMGDLKVELYDDEKPITVTNFLRYATSGAYAGGFFHRAVHDFVIQGGAFGIANQGTANARFVTFPTLPPIANEFAVGPLLPNVKGTIAMAKTSDPNSATSQYFFNLKDNAALDSPANSGGFTVFGHVVSGWPTLTNWNSFRAVQPPATNLIVNAGSSVLSELPVYQLQPNGAGSYSITFGDLVYVDITLLDVEVKRRGDGAAEIHWSPLANRTNTVEFTTEFPPKWQVLSNVPPAKPATAIVVDPVVDPNRFYRVRATY